MTKTAKPRGFAAMDPQKRREIAAKGGAAIKPEDRSFAKDRGLAARAGALGGKNTPAETRSFSQDRDLARTAGRKGGRIGGGHNKAVLDPSDPVDSEGAD